MFAKNKVWDQINSVLYDLTNLEINTIIKEDMTASKASDSPRVLLNEIAAKYSQKLKDLGDKYKTEINTWEKTCKNLRKREGEEKKDDEGSGYYSFRKLSDWANAAFNLLNGNRGQISAEKEEIDSDLMLLQRIITLSDNLRDILKSYGEDQKGSEYNFDKKEAIGNFRQLKYNDPKRNKYELHLDLRERMVIKKAHDLGTERIVLQTIIGLDGDVTTRISKSFAEHPVTFINDLHQEGITISVNYWKTLVTILSEFGSSLVKLLVK